MTEATPIENKNRPMISVVAPVWNEVEGILELHRRISTVLDGLSDEYQGEIVIGDDGSTDGTSEILLGLTEVDPRLVVVRLSRNFGHQSCILAAMSRANGDYVILMDGDLEDPPEEIPNLLLKAKSGADVVLAVRISRQDVWRRLILFGAFHRLIHFLSDFPIPSDVGTFCLLSRKASNAMLTLGETNRFLPGLRAWIGFETSRIEYERQGRYAGAPRQTMSRLFRYAFDAIFGFSYKPLRLSMYIGLASWVISAAYALGLVSARLLRINVVLGFTTTSVLILFFGGMSLMSIGLLGEYVARIYDEVKRRPHYLIKSTWKSGRNID
ncbi:MAG: glycosyltransferase family 2 protein [Fibrobacteria bacterium]|nr:glycosyltransferase family 2 protein [Fibrobacteria bacterium]